MHGDITYLVIQPFNQDLLTVTCNRSGIYENNVNKKNKNYSYYKIRKNNKFNSFLKEYY